MYVQTSCPELTLKSNVYGSKHLKEHKIKALIQQIAYQYVFHTVEKPEIITL